MPDEKNIPVLTQTTYSCLCIGLLSMSGKGERLKLTTPSLLQFSTNNKKYAIEIKMNVTRGIMLKYGSIRSLTGMITVA